MKHDKIVSLAKSKLNKIEVLISKTSIDSNISHDELVLINNVLKEYDEMKEEIKNWKIQSPFWLIYVSVYWRFQFICKTMLWCVEKIQKVKIQKS